MPTLSRVFSVAMLCACGAAARAQFAAPGDAATPPDTTVIAPPSNPGSSAASPGGGLLNIGPPPATSRPADPAALPGPANSGPLMPLRPNQVMTTNAMIGFVNDEPVFLNDVFRPIDADLRRLASTSKTLADFKQSARILIDSQLSHMMTEILVVAAAQTQLTDEDKGHIDIYLALERSKLIAEHGGSIPAADRALAANGTSVDRAIADLRRAAIEQIYRQKNIDPHVVVTRQMELDAYNKDPKRWQQVAQVEMYTLTLPITRWLRGPTMNGRLGDILTNPTTEQVRAAEREALASAVEICAQLRAGADFARLVEDKDSHDGARTTGGRTPSVTRGSMVNAAFEDYVFSLPANTLGEPQLIRQPDFHDSMVIVVKIGKKTEARTIPFSEAQAKLVQELKVAQRRELESKAMDKLSNGAAIEAVDRMRGVALDAAVTRYAMN